MTTTQENIQKKEDSLAALMQKVLDAPLRPLNESLNNIKNELTLVQEEIIEKISGQIGASIDDIEKIKASGNDIKIKKFPALKSEMGQMTQHISAKIDQENQNLETSIGEKFIQYTADFQSASTELLSVILEIRNQNKELEQRLKTWVAELYESNEASKEQQSTAAQATTHAIFLNRELIEKIRTDLSSQITASHMAITSEVAAEKNYVNNKIEEQMAILHSTNHIITSFKKQSEELNQRLLDQFNANQCAISDLKNTFEGKNSNLVDVFNQNNKSIEKEIVLTRKKMRKLMVFFGIFFLLMLAHVGYDILNHFQ